MKALQRNQTWGKDELLDVVYWFRQIVGVVLGIAFGIAGVQGALGNIGFWVLSTVSGLVYYALYLGIDEEDFGGRWKLMQEGAMPAYASFLTLWILVHTALI
eukprot:tig00022075_g23605.t1